MSISEKGLRGVLIGHRKVFLRLGKPKGFYRKEPCEGKEFGLINPWEAFLVYKSQKLPLVKK